MDYRSPLKQLLHTLLPIHADPAARPEDFENTRPDDSRARPRAEKRPRDFAPTDNFPGTEVMEFSDDTAADLMDEFFSTSERRAA